ncbi:hypothetical protein [Sedimentibacter sp. B4]|uniref:hypothetical protein n=1 Tax=Sedimentibacter sp. B4 TaxID=304766 RepID=UPI00030F77F5|nr:hypothetical protein [Sedimentibacter sp. B4]
MDDNIKVKRIESLSDSIIVFISPIIAYLLQYVYEIGYTRYFGIPIEFISIDISKFLLILGGSWSVIVFLFFFINLLIILFHGVDNYIVREIKSHIPMALICIMTAAIYGRSNWKIALPSVFIFVFVVLLTFVLPLLTQRSKLTYREKLEAQAKMEREIIDISSILYKLIGRSGMLLVITLIIAFNFSYNTGVANAMNKQDFITISNKPDTIALCKYGDFLICSKVDKINKYITKEFSIINIHDKPNIIYKIENFTNYTVKK